MNLNKAILIGRLTSDPESKALPSGQSVVSFGLATDRVFYDKAGQKQQKTEFHNIVIFGKLAEIASQYLTKGSLVYLEGRIQTRAWKDASGAQRTRTEIVAERMQMGPKNARKEYSSPQPQSREEQQPATEEIPIIEEDKEINISEIPF